MRIFIVIFLIIISNSAFSGDWNKHIAYYIEVYKKSSEQPRPIVYPQLAQRIKNTFLSNAKNLIRIENEENGKRALSTELYYAESQLTIVQHRGGWNLVTQGDYVFEWKYGEKTGIKAKKDEKALVDYILYITDPSFIMTSLYNGYNTKPENFYVPEKNDKTWKEIALKKPFRGFEAIFVNVNSLWFHGYKMTQPKTKDVVISYINAPKKYQTLPASIKKAMAAVKFEESELSVRRHMIFL